MKIILLMFLFLIVTSCTFRKEISYQVFDKKGNIVLEEVISSNITNAESMTTIIVTHGEGSCTTEVEFTYESGVHTLDFNIKGDKKTTLKTISFTKVKPQEIELGNGYKVRINMRNENKALD